MKTIQQIIVLSLFCLSCIGSIAQAGAAATCQDSSFHIRYYNTNATDAFTISHQIPASNGGRLAIGQLTGTANAGAMVIKFNNDEEVAWSKKIITPTGYSNCSLYAITEAGNGNIALAGIITENTTSSYFYKAILNAAGTLLMQEMFRFPAADGSIKGVHTVCRLSADSLAFLYYSNTFTSSQEGLCIMLCDNAGNTGYTGILGIQMTETSIAFSAVAINGKTLTLYGSGYAGLVCNNVNQTGTFTAIQYNLATQQPGYHKTYCVPFTTYTSDYPPLANNAPISNLSCRVFFLRNGTIAMVRGCKGNSVTAPITATPLYISYFDQSFNLIRSEFVQSKLFFKTPTIQDIFIDSNGAKHISFTDYNNKAVYYAVADSNNHFILQKKLPIPDLESFNLDHTVQVLQPGMFTGITLQNTTATRSYLHYIQIQQQDTASTCFGTDTAFLSFIPSANTANIASASIQAYPATTFATPVTIPIADLPLVKEDVCITKSAPLTSFAITGDTLYCPGKTNTLKAPEGFNNYTWQNGSTESTFTTTSAGTYYVTATDNCNRQYSDTVTLNANDATLSAGADVTICQGESIALSATEGFSNYAWSPDYHITAALGRTVTVNPDVTTSYWVQADLFAGCTLSDTVTVTVNICPQQFAMPNAFTPNGDGRNEVFKPHISGVLKQYELTIYNRWGQVVFATTNKNQGWNGLVNGTLANSMVFIWVCKYQFVNQPQQIQKGVVTLLR